MDEGVMTLGFARRAATYKRADFLFSNLDRLKWIAQHVGPFQVIFSGKAHPYDESGKALIRHARLLGLRKAAVVYLRGAGERAGADRAVGREAVGQLPAHVRARDRSGSRNESAGGVRARVAWIARGWWGPAVALRAPFGPVLTKNSICPR
jgi:starch phosphorylase